ncbi:secreted RxLR effector protein 161-like [Hevea brasiliensis]|uniref:secreted RxLR effector protein 161-like n=1 Tax=Hevea brasiliensis TaxID=3981 RepID=UPI0025F09428|nr:secreted RxLR effector protein 161-like [Hevea brasiliensis]
MPDIAYTVSVTNRTKDLFLTYGGDELQLEGFTNSDFQSDIDDKKSISRFVFLCKESTACWKSSKQTTTADSTTKAEYVAACDAAKEVVWIKKFISE